MAKPAFLEYYPRFEFRCTVSNQSHLVRVCSLALLQESRKILHLVGNLFQKNIYNI